jgi:hypothetical protein
MRIETPLATIRQAIDELYPWTLPSGRERVIKSVVAVMAATKFHPEWDSSPMIAELYVRALGALPPDLLAAACLHVTASQRYTHPMTGDFMAVVADEWRARGAHWRALELMHARAAKQPKNDEWQPPRDDEKARVKAVLDKVLNR